VLICLDSNIAIYFVEQPVGFGPRATARINAAVQNGDQLAISDLTRLEARIGPISKGNSAVLTRFENFFASPTLIRIPLTGPVIDRATLIRAQYRYGLGDSLNLAAAVEAGCQVFLTNDGRLNRFADLAVEVLP
jgi:predicted nucleic acid-binding protein